MAFQLPQGYYEMGAGQMPGLNTMANAYQQGTTTLGPSLLSYLATQQAKEASLAETARQRLTNLISAMGQVQGQQAMREQGKASTVAGMLKDPDSVAQLKKGLPGKKLLNPMTWLTPGPTQDQLALAAAKQYDIVNPMVGTAGLQNTQNILQQLINQQLGQSMLPQAALPAGGQSPVIYTTASGRPYYRDAQGNPVFLT